MDSIEKALNDLLSLDGAQSAAVVDYSSGLVLGSVGAGWDMELAAGGNAEVVRAKIRTIELLKLDDKIEDILITLEKQYHLIRPISTTQDLFIYYMLDRKRANLALARRILQNAEEGLLIQ